MHIRKILILCIGMLLVVNILVTIPVPAPNDEDNDNDANIYVDDDADPSWYDAFHVRTIQEGIDNASSGDTVYVYNGTYFENLNVNKSIELVGENPQKTIIDGKGDTVMSLTEDNVIVSLVTLTNATYELSNLDPAVKLAPAGWYQDYHSFSDCIIRDVDNGFDLGGSSYNHFQNITFYNVSRRLFNLFW